MMDWIWCSVSQAPLNPSLIQFSSHSTKLQCHSIRWRERPHTRDLVLPINVMAIGAVYHLNAVLHPSYCETKCIRNKNPEMKWQGWLLSIKNDTLILIRLLLQLLLDALGARGLFIFTASKNLWNYDVTPSVRPYSFLKYVERIWTCCENLKLMQNSDGTKYWLNIGLSGRKRSLKEIM